MSDYVYHHGTCYLKRPKIRGKARRKAMKLARRLTRHGLPIPPRVYRRIEGVK